MKAVPNNGQPQDPAEQVRAHIQIVLFQDGRILVTAPYQDPITCFGLLEFARLEVIAALKVATPRIQAPTPGQIDHLSK